MAVFLYILSMFTVYILINKDNTTYVGYTENLERRLAEHNSIQSNKGGWTHGRWPWQVLHQEEFTEKQQAIQCEKWYKSWIWRKKIQSFKI